MFFAIKRKRATQEAVKAVVPLVRIYSISGGSLSKFWVDPYAIGFIWGAIAYVALISTRGKLTKQESGRVLHDAIERIAGSEAPFVIERGMMLFGAGDLEFDRGGKNAQKVLGYSLGVELLQDDPVLEEARKIAPSLARLNSSLGATISSERSIIADALLHLLFTNEMKRIQ